MTAYHTQIEIEGNYYDLEIDYDYFAREKGAWCDGQKVEPDIPAWVEISEVKIDHSDKCDPSSYEPISFPDSFLEVLASEILEHEH